MPRSALAKVVAAACLMLLGGLVWLLALAHSDPAAPSVLPPRGPAWVWFVDGADAHGAIVDRFSTHPGLTQVDGYLSDGRQGWRIKTGSNPPGGEVCLARCPDAVLFSSYVTMNEPQTADPDMRWIRGGRVDNVSSGIPSSLPGKEVVFAALSRSVFVAQRSDLRGRNQVYLADPQHSASLSLPPLAQARAWADPTLRHVVVFLGSTTTRLQTVVWLSRGVQGWREVGRLHGIDAESACVSDDGRHGIVLGQRATELDLSSPTPSNEALAVPAGAGNCAFSSRGPVFVSNSVSPGGQRSVVTQLDASGALVWSRNAAQSVTLSADPQSPDVVLSVSAQHRGVEVLDSEGKVARRMSADAGLIAGQDVVTVSHVGKVTWTPLPK
ncbi:MAG: hypothetical protein ACRDPG_06850 [Nocardioidaceae bacterium]